MLRPEQRWHQSARLIESIVDRGWSARTTRDSSGEYTVEAGGALGEASRSSLEAFVYDSTRELFSRHEAAIRKAPEQWRGWSKLLT